MALENNCIKQNFMRYNNLSSWIIMTVKSFWHTERVNCSLNDNPDSKVHVAHMGPTWVLSTPGGPHVGPMNLAIREVIYYGPNMVDK